MNNTFFDGHDEQSLGKIVERARKCRCENEVFVAVFFFCLSRSAAGALFFRGGHSSNKYCVTDYRSILMRFSPFFSEAIVLSDALHSSHFCR